MRQEQKLDENGEPVVVNSKVETLDIPVMHRVPRMHKIEEREEIARQSTLNTSVYTLVFLLNRLRQRLII